MQGQNVHVCGCACKTVHRYETGSLLSMLLYFKSCGCNMRHQFWHLVQPIRGPSSCLHHIAISLYKQSAGGAQGDIQFDIVNKQRAVVREQPVEAFSSVQQQEKQRPLEDRQWQGKPQPAHPHALPAELSTTLSALFHLYSCLLSLPLFFSLTPILQLKVTQSRKLAVGKRGLGRGKRRSRGFVTADWCVWLPIVCEDTVVSLVSSIGVRWELAVRRGLSIMQHARLITLEC